MQVESSVLAAIKAGMETSIRAVLEAQLMFVNKQH
jgi:hypothetical protein